MLTVASVNVNGLRAATRKGMHEWLAQRQPDILTLQEVRAPDELVADLLGPGWHIAHAESLAKGRAGVAVATRIPHRAARFGDHHRSFTDNGRWVEVDLRLADGSALTVISAYAHTGDETSAERMAEKLAWFDAATERLTELRRGRRHVLLTGDLNVAHREADLKNWKGNIGKAGFLPEERAHFDRWFDELGWVDVARTLAGDVPGPYSWWSYRGKAFDTDAGWRIDYLIASPRLGELATMSTVDRADSYAERWSDHAPVVAQFDL